MTGTFIPYGLYWSTPFAKWQGSLAHLHSIRLAAHSALQALAAKAFPLADAKVAGAPPSAGRPRNAPLRSQTDVGFAGIKMCPMASQGLFAP